MEFDNNKVAVVSGGSKGLGLRICGRLLDDGYRVGTFSRNCSEEINTLATRRPDAFFWRSVDICDHAQLSAYLKTVRRRFGRIGYLVNSAGIAPEGLLTLMAYKDISNLMRINVEGAIRLCRMCARQMMVGGFGAIVNISSIVGIRGYKGVGAYSATKAALDGLTRSLCKELGPMGIRINSVAPGFMETDMTARLTEKQKARIIRQTPLGRLGTVDDVALVVSYLLSDKARFITGQSIVVDGGLTV